MTASEKKPVRKLLLTSICRPIGPLYGDGPSVGYELLHGQVTRAQGMFSPRATHVNFSLDYIAENLDIPAVILHYPSRRELIKELKKGYEFVGLSFILSTFHRMKEAVALIREHSPGSRIILGGYGTVIEDKILMQYGDFICRGEGVGFMRSLLGEPEARMPYKHPLIESRLKLFGVPVSTTGMIFAGLGCPNGCDFCCTSHFFKRKHVKLLPDGRDIYGVIERYLRRNPAMAFTIIDEDFLLDKKRAMEFRDCVLAGDRTVSIFLFSSIKALSQYTVLELLEMGIDGVWIGYEGTRSGYGKQSGRPADELITELRENGVTVLTSMILGFDYQNPEIIRRELDGLMKLEPAFSQFLVYGPTPGTPFYERVTAQNLLQTKYSRDFEKYCHDANGFSALVKHPSMSEQEILELQKWCFEEDFQRLGPSIYRSVSAWLKGYRKWRVSPSAFLRKKAAAVALDLRRTYPIFLSGKLFGPNPAVRRRIKELEAGIQFELGSPTLKEKILSVLSLAAGAWTALALRFNLFQHPSLSRTAFRMPEEGLSPAHLWESLKRECSSRRLSIEVDFQHRKEQVWVRMEGMLDRIEAEKLAARIKESLEKSRGKLVLDLEKLKLSECQGLKTLAEKLKDYRGRIRVNLPRNIPAHAAEFMFMVQLFKIYRA